MKRSILERKVYVFHPWRNEETELLCTFSTFKEHYESIRHMLDHKCSKFEHPKELELARNLADAEYDAFDEIAPSTQQVACDDAEIQLLSKIFINSDFCHNYLHTLYVFACLL